MVIGSKSSSAKLFIKSISVDELCGIFIFGGAVTTLGAALVISSVKLVVKVSGWGSDISRLIT
jgi:hypothetical protein